MKLATKLALLLLSLAVLTGGAYLWNSCQQRRFEGVDREVGEFEQAVEDFDRPIGTGGAG